MNITTRVVAAAALAACASMPALAVTVEVGPGTVAGLTSAGGCLDSSLSPEATACFGVVSGNNLGNSAPGADATINFINTVWTGVDTSAVNTVNGPLDADAGLAGFQIDLGTSFSGDVVLALKQANGFSLYFYDDLVGTQYITFTDNDGFGGTGNLGISHFTQYGGELVPGIPEPQTYALMLAGLAAVGFMARRRRAD
jgi:PEP-CTERM motif